MKTFHVFVIILGILSYQTTFAMLKQKPKACPAVSWIQSAGLSFADYEADIQ